jgi:RNA polymerase sigma-54 factor
MSGAHIGLSLTLATRQTQSLALTPQLLQAIRLLQMSAGELEEFVGREIEANPLLDGQPADGVTVLAPGAADASGGHAESASEDGFPAADPSRPERFPSIGRMSGVPGRTRSARLDGEGPDLENLAGAPTSLAAHVERQVAAVFRRPDDLAIARLLVSELDESGYLPVEPEDIAGALSCPVAHVLRVLERCQEMEPTGIFARSLGECLALQLAERNRLDPAMQALLDHLPLLASGDLAELRRRCGVDDDDLADMIAEIRALDPKPGLAFAGEPPQALVPDILVRRGGTAGWTVEFNEAALPRVLVDRTYYAEICGKVRREEERRYIDACLSQASWLERSLDQRARTVLAVAAEVVRHQEGFLAHGLSELRPLALRDIAAATGLHESTVSRATVNKAMATPRGTFPLRFFFSNALSSTSGGDGHSAAAVKHRLQRLIAAEPPDRPLSDDALAAVLRGEGVDIARRTVTKYREQCGIASSSVRRRRAAS